MLNYSTLGDMVWKFKALGYMMSEIYASEDATPKFKTLRNVI